LLLKIYEGNACLFYGKSAELFLLTSEDSSDESFYFEFFYYYLFISYCMTDSSPDKYFLVLFELYDSSMES